MQQVHVALVRRRAVERLRPQQAAPGGLEHQRAVAPVEPEPAVVARHARREHASIARGLLQLGPQRLQAVGVGGHVGFAGDDNLLDEAAHPGSEGGGFRRR